MLNTYTIFNEAVANFIFDADVTHAGAGTGARRLVDSFWLCF